MTQLRLNNIALLRYNRDYLSKTDFDVIKDEFISRSTIRQNTFAAK
jgi:hypothetical protein